EPDPEIPETRHEKNQKPEAVSPGSHRSASGGWQTDKTLKLKTRLSVSQSVAAGLSQVALERNDRAARFRGVFFYNAHNRACM
ncbi:unnamed protein product, partial [Callosobruchus maculatus]